MTDFLITAPDGQKYKVTGDSQEGAIAALKKMLGGQQAAPASPNDANNARAAAARAGTLPQITPERAAQQAAIDGGVADQITLSKSPAAMQVLDKFNQGLPFIGEYTDELTGLLSEPAINLQRETRAAMDRQNPKTAMASQIAGGVVGSIPMLAASAPAMLAKAPASMAAKVGLGGLLGAVTGGTEGAISGYGAGEGDTRGQSALDRGLVGGAFGGILGAAAPIVAKGIGTAYSAIADKVAQRSRQLPGLSKDATAQIMLRAQADDMAGAGASRIAAAGPDGMVADAGPAMRGLTDQAANMSMSGANIAGTAVDTRAAASAGRLNDVFDTVMGGADGPKALSTAIRSAKQPGIKAAYEAAYNTPIDYSAASGRKIEEILARLPKKEAAAAIAKAQSRMVYDGVPAQQIMAQIADDGSVVFTEKPNVIMVDYIKRAFSEIAQDSKDSMTGRMTSDGAFAGNIAADLRNALGDAVPAYKTALAEASDEFALQDAVTLGRKLLSPATKREAVTEWAATATPIERSALASGLRSEIDDMMGEVKRTVSDGNVDARQAAAALRAMSSDNARAKLTEVFTPDQAKVIFAQLDEATAALELRAGIAQNSKTAARTVGDAITKQTDGYSAQGILREAASGGILEGPRRAARILAGNTPMDQVARNEKLYGEIAQYLTGPRGAAAQKAAQDMGGLLNWLPGANAARDQVGRVGAGGLGLLGYLSATQAHTK